VQNRQSVLQYVRRAPRYILVVHQADPIVLEPIDDVVPIPGNVVRYSIDPARNFGGIFHVPQYHRPGDVYGRIPAIGHETMMKYPGDAVRFHPFEVPQYHVRSDAREEFRMRTIRHRNSRFHDVVVVVFVGRGVHVHDDILVRGRGAIDAEPMPPPSDGRAVPGISEPSLIAAYYPIVEHVCRSTGNDERCRRDGSFGNVVE
jgi:hypothetical protein